MDSRAVLSFDGNRSRIGTQEGKLAEARCSFFFVNATKPQQTMTYHNIAGALLLLAVAIGFSRPSYGMQQAGDFMPGRVLVQFKEGVLPQKGAAKTGLVSFDRAAERFGVVAVAQAFPSIEAAAAKREISAKAQALRRVYDVRYSGPYDPKMVAEKIAGDPDVENAEPRVVYRLAWDGLLPTEARAVPNDTEFHDQTHFNNLRMTEAWDVAKGEDSDVLIAIVDSGTDWNHPDLRDNVWTNPGEIPLNGVDDDGNGYVDDIRGWNFGNNSADPNVLPNSSEASDHGTWVAGVAAAVTNNASGIAGTGWNARFMAVNVSCSSGGFVCYGADGVAYAALNGADVITASWGNSTESSFERAVVEMALEEGALVVAASSNTVASLDELPVYPAAYAATLSVGGTKKDSDQSVFSYGRSVNVFAPALQIDATTPGDGYVEVSGVSFAVPLVAGIAALVKTAFPNFSPNQLREQIRLTSDRMEEVNPENLAGLLGRGRVNAYRAVTESTPPGIRLEDWMWMDVDGHSDLESSGTVQGMATFTNYGGDAQALTVGLESPSPFVEFVRASEVVGALAHGASHSATFEFTLADNTPDYYQALVYTTIADGEFEDSPDILRFSVNEVEVATHYTGALVTSITNEGNIGYIEGQGFSPGRGFRVRDRDGFQRDLLYEGGLLLGTGPDTISDCVRATNTGPHTGQHNDLVLKAGTSLHVVSPGQLTSQQGRVELVDTDARNPLGVTVLQESYVDSAPENEDFMILKYTVTNANEAASLSNLYVGLFFDWDVQELNEQRDVARFDMVRMVGYVEDGFNPTAAAGVKVLTNNAGLSYGALESPITGFTERNKWDLLSGGIGRKELRLKDVSQLMGAGPFSLLPKQSVTVAFAVLGGTSGADLLENADNAQLLWDTVLEPASRPTEIQLIHNVAGLDVDIYLDGERMQDDWVFRSATGYSALESRSQTLDVVAATAVDNTSPLASIDFEFEVGTSNQIFVYGNAEEVRLVAVKDVRKEAEDEASVGLYVAHGASDAGAVTLRLRDPEDGYAVYALLEDNLDFGDTGSYHVLEPRAFEIEVAVPGSLTPLDAYRFDFGGLGGKSMVLGLSGAGTNASEGLALLGVLPSGEVRLAAEASTALSTVQLFHNVAGLSLDVYLDGVRLQDDWSFQSATGFADLLRGRHMLQLVDAEAQDNAVPLASLEIDMEAGMSSQVMAYGNEEEVQLVALAGVRTVGGSQMVGVRMAHGARDVGEVAVRLLDPDAENREHIVLESSLGFGSIGEVNETDVRTLNVEVAGGAVLEVYSFDFGGLEEQVFTLGLSGAGASAEEGLTLMGVLPSGEVRLPLAVVTASEAGAVLPEAFVLRGNYPNPFNPSTRIVFDLPAAAHVTAELVDILGRVVKQVPLREYEAGAGRSLEISALDLASGLYFYRVTAVMDQETVMQTGRITLVK